MQIDLLELLQHQEEEAGLIEFGDGVVEVELFQHLAHVVAEASDVIAQVGGEVGRVLEQALEIESVRCCRRQAGSPAELGIEVCQLAPIGWYRQDTFAVGASTQSMRRKTVSGRMTSWYLPRLKVSRMRSAILQMKLACSLKVFI